MPNGEPNFDVRAQDEWFAPIADAIIDFAEEHRLLVEKYYHDFPSWSLRFRHPNGGSGSIAVTNIAAETASITAGWWFDDYDQFTRFLHFREPVTVPRLPDAVGKALGTEFVAIVATSFGDWTKIASGFEREWKRYSKEEFDAMAPKYPLPKISSSGG